MSINSIASNLTAGTVLDTAKATLANTDTSAKIDTKDSVEKSPAGKELSKADFVKASQISDTTKHNTGINAEIENDNINELSKYKSSNYTIAASDNNTVRNKNINDNISLKDIQNPKPGTIEYGAMQVVKNCLKVQPGEKTVIITDKETKHIADAIVKQLNLVSPKNTKVFVMEDFGPRPDDGSKPLAFPKEIAAAMQDPKTNVCIYAAQCKNGELQSFRDPMLDLVQKIVDDKGLKYAHMPLIDDTIMKEAMSADYSQIQKLCAQVYDIVKDAKSIHVTTAAGSDFTAEFNPNWKWDGADGAITPKKWSNLPDGEVFTCPSNMNGKVVVDGVLGDYFCAKYGLL